MSAPKVLIRLAYNEVPLLAFLDAAIARESAEASGGSPLRVEVTEVGEMPDGFEPLTIVYETVLVEREFAPYLTVDEMVAQVMDADVPAGATVIGVSVTGEWHR